jgi:hypothetical protein
MGKGRRLYVFSITSSPAKVLRWKPGFIHDEDGHEAFYSYWIDEDIFNTYIMNVLDRLPIVAYRDIIHRKIGDKLFDDIGAVRIIP